MLIIPKKTHYWWLKEQTATLFAFVVLGNLSGSLGLSSRDHLHNGDHSSREAELGSIVLQGVWFLECRSDVDSGLIWVVEGTDGISSLCCVYIVNSVGGSCVLSVFMKESLAREKRPPICKDRNGIWAMWVWLALADPERCRWRSPLEGEGRRSRIHKQAIAADVDKCVTLGCLLPQHLHQHVVALVHISLSFIVLSTTKRFLVRLWL